MEKWSQIHDALMNLPGRKAKYHVHGSTMAEILFIGCDPRAEDVLGSIRPFPGMPVLKYPAWRKTSSLNAAEKQIKKILSSAGLKKNYEEMNQTAIYALVENGADFKTLDNFARTAPDAVKGALVLIEKWKTLNPKRKSSRSGQPQKRRASHLAKLLAKEYFNATGKTPSVATNESTNKAYGPYFNLVQEVFWALEIKASPEAMCKEAASRWRKQEKAKIQASNRALKLARKQPEPVKSLLLGRLKAKKIQRTSAPLGRPRKSSD